MPDSLHSPPVCVVCRSTDPGDRYPIHDQSVCQRCLRLLARCDSCRERVIELTDTAEGHFAAWVAQRGDYRPLLAEMEDLACAC
ncbi:hypothetical protein ACIBJI_34705 [Nocardia sp. NPDC050408]|uniref:hypothetical protein n=1 Tax=Nocardia sp. NPDC050408 TaxID=3364319 RepID=UPI00379C0397